MHQLTTGTPSRTKGQVGAMSFLQVVAAVAKALAAVGAA
jgi:hypothetical protein